MTPKKIKNSLKMIKSNRFITPENKIFKNNWTRNLTPEAKRRKETNKTYMLKNRADTVNHAKLTNYKR